MKLTAGAKSTEFWASLAVAIGAIATSAINSGAIPPKYAVIVSAVVALGYSLSRGWAKTQIVPDPTTTQPPTATPPAK